MTRYVIVFGSPLWCDRARIANALAEVFDPEIVLAVADSKFGAAPLVAECWEAWGGIVERHRLNWTEHGGVAPARRRAAMLELEPLGCLGFAAGGTCVESDCAAAAAAGIRVRVHRGPARRLPRRLAGKRSA